MINDEGEESLREQEEENQLEEEGKGKEEKIEKHERDENNQWDTTPGNNSGRKRKTDAAQSGRRSKRHQSGINSADDDDVVQ